MNEKAKISNVTSPAVKIIVETTIQIISIAEAIPRVICRCVYLVVFMINKESEK